MAVYFIPSVVDTNILFTLVNLPLGGAAAASCTGLSAFTTRALHLFCPLRPCVLCLNLSLSLGVAVL